jgi:hypothetical protein
MELKRSDHSWEFLSRLAGMNEWIEWIDSPRGRGQEGRGGGGVLYCKVAVMDELDELEGNNSEKGKKGGWDVMESMNELHSFLMISVD